MRLTILEGPDGAGKTTLAKETYKDHEYYHLGPPPRGKDSAFWQCAELLRRLEVDVSPDRKVVIDRFCYGELIYGPVLRGGTDLSWAHVRMLERVLLGLEASLVICLPPFKHVQENWQKNRDNELIQSVEDLWKVYNFYMTQLTHQVQLIPWGVWDYATQEYKFRPSMVNAFPNEGPGIGCFCPGNTLLVGDQVNARQGYEGWPFVSATGSSIWLAQYLTDNHIPERSLYWINSWTAGEETDSRFVDKLQPNKIIALGGRAALWCKRHQLACTMVAHPQYHKRFHHHEPYDLARLING